MSMSTTNRSGSVGASSRREVNGQRGIRIELAAPVTTGARAANGPDADNQEEIGHPIGTTAHISPSKALSHLILVEGGQPAADVPPNSSYSRTELHGLRAGAIDKEQAGEICKRTVPVHATGPPAGTPPATAVLPMTASASKVMGGLSYAEEASGTVGAGGAGAGAVFNGSALVAPPSSYM